MYAERDLDILNDNPNTYDPERDGPIDMPVTEALELADRILNSKSDAEILTALTSAKAHAKIKASDDQAAFEHDQVRITFLALNFAANHRCLLAPAFRERLRPAIRPSGQGKAQLPELIDVIYSLDRQLIDLHWLFCRENERGNLNSPKIDDYQVWVDGVLKPESAEDFVQLNWKASKKAEKLHIIEDDQLELGILRSKQVSDRSFDLQRSHDADFITIKEYCIKSRQLSLSDIEPMYKDLVALRLTQQDVPRASRLRRLIGDIEKDESAIQKQMRRRKSLFKEKLRLLR